MDDTGIDSMLLILPRTKVATRQIRVRSLQPTEEDHRCQFCFCIVVGRERGSAWGGSSRAVRGLTVVDSGNGGGG